MRGRVIGQVDLDRCLSHCDEKTDEGDCVGGNKHRGGESPTGIRKSNDERFFYTGSFQICLFHLCICFFSDRFFFFVCWAFRLLFWPFKQGCCMNLVSLQVSMARFLGWLRPHHRPSVKTKVTPGDDWNLVMETTPNHGFRRPNLRHGALMRRLL